MVLPVVSCAAGRAVAVQVFRAHLAAPADPAAAAVLPRRCRRCCC